jgi:hypothetical protein
MIKRKTSTPVERLPDEVIDVARAVIAVHYTGELEVFEDILDDYQEDPDGTASGVRLDAPVGVGVELAAMTPWVLTAAGVVGGVLAEKAVDSAYEAVRGWLGRAWARRRTSDGAEPVPQWDDTEVEQVAMMIIVCLRGYGADEEIAREIAYRVIGELVTGARPQVGSE